jgi:hypothetical protein
MLVKFAREKKKQTEQDYLLIMIITAVLEVNLVVAVLEVYYVQIATCL